ncbi:MAG TPA: radical SAM protein, partial [Bacillota bacterium]|nr:radical SAM protein [Bacillota bacterium]
AGLKRVNISLDTLKPERFNRITRGGSLDTVWKGIEAALEEGLQPVKLNCIAMKGFNDDEILDFARLTVERPLHVRFIELMPIGESAGWAGASRMPVEEVQATIASLGELQPMGSDTGGGPAKYYTLPGAQGTIGFISPMSRHFCHSCNRIRLTAEGKLRTCLHSRRELDLRNPVRQGASREELALLMATEVSNKPLEHSMVEKGWADNVRVMSQIGG